MLKYSYELKLEVVQAYQRGKGGYQHLANEYGISSKSQVKQWVKQFEANGKDGLKKSEKNLKKNQKYSFSFKLSLVEYYLTAEISYSELARKNNINNSSMIVRWVQDFHKKGLDGLREKAKGRVSKMLKNPPKPSKTEKISKKNRENPSQEDYIKELEEKPSCFEEKW